MILRFDPDGTALAIYGEAIDLRELGATSIRRASHVEPTPDGDWTAAMVGGPVLGPYPTRSEALAAEVAWLTDSITHTTTEQKDTTP